VQESTVMTEESLLAAIGLEKIGTGKDLQVVIGASKPLGRAVVDELASEGSKVRAVVQREATVSDSFPASVEVVTADPLDQGSMVEACRGGTTVYGCHQPNYSTWKEVYPQVTANVLFASIDVRADLVFASHVITRETDNSRQENDVFNAHNSNLIRTMVVRMPQLYGERVVNKLWQGIFDSVAAGKKAHWMGDLDVERSLLYVGDAASKMVLLGKSLWAFGRAWNLAGPVPISGKSFIEAAFKAAGKDPRIGHWGRGVMLTGSLLASDAKGFLELPYNYYESFILDGSEFSEAFRSAPYLPHEEAVARTYRWFEGSR